MNPRNRFYHLLLAFHTVLLLSVCCALWVANRRATLLTRAALADLDRRVASISLDSARATSCDTPPDSSREISRDISPQVARSTGWVRVPPRVLGSGRSGPWMYLDVVYGDGASRRHFVRTNSTPREVKSFVRLLSSEANEHSWCFVPDDDG